jgi:hypothetical protein
MNTIKAFRELREKTHKEIVENFPDKAYLPKSEIQELEKAYEDFCSLDEKISYMTEYVLSNPIRRFFMWLFKGKPETTLGDFSKWNNAKQYIRHYLELAKTLKESKWKD